MIAVGEHNMVQCLLRETMHLPIHQDAFKSRTAPDICY